MVLVESTPSIFVSVSNRVSEGIGFLLTTKLSGYGLTTVLLVIAGLKMSPARLARLCSSARL